MIDIDVPHGYLEILELWNLPNDIFLLNSITQIIMICSNDVSCTHFRRIPSRGTIVLKLDTKACQGTDTEVDYLEHVQAVVTLNSTRRGDVNIYMTSPMGTR